MQFVMPSRRATGAGRCHRPAAGVALVSVVLGLAACTSSTPPTAFVTPPAAPISTCGLQPGPANTGATGTRTPQSDTVVKGGAVLENVDVASLDITGNDVTVRNVEVDGNILVKGDRVTLDHVTAKAIAVSSASNVTIRYTNLGASQDDAIHITSDSGRVVRDVLLEYNYVHSPQVPATAHYDGTQVRGADGVVIRCSTYDPGPYQQSFNAAVYLENANGGDRNVTVRDNWLRGFGYTFMVDATGTTIRDNVLGGTPHWGTCYLGTDMSPTSVTASGNVAESDGSAMAVCDGT